MVLVLVLVLGLGIWEAGVRTDYGVTVITLVEYSGEILSVSPTL